MTKRCRRGRDKGKSIYLRLDDLQCTIEITIGIISTYLCMSIPSFTMQTSIVHRKSSNRK